MQKGMKAPQLDYNKFGADFSKYGNPVILEELARKMNFAGKFEVSNVLARNMIFPKEETLQSHVGSFHDYLNDL